MRNLLILPIIFMSFMADFGAFAATARNVRGGANVAGNTGGNAPVAARAAVRGVTTNTQSVAPVAARAAQRNTPKTAQPAVSGAVAARAGAKKSAINKGTKVAAATANTIVSQDCQDAFFGCMDSFCMLENATGGRCKCSDKNTEYDERLAEIMEMDQQTYVMQTEGVSWLKMGNSADEVYARAEEAAKRAVKDKKEEKKEEAKTTLGFSYVNESFFNPDDEEDDEDDYLSADLVSVTGEKLLARAGRACSSKMPNQCKDSVSLLRMMYTSKVQSDCAAYDNSLTQQKLESEQKLQTANQALLAASLEKFQEENKYDLGGCVIEYAKCMQKEEVCGAGYANCVTLSAAENMASSSVGTKTDQLLVSKATGLITNKFNKKSGITLSMATIDQLNAKRVLCDGVLNQCVKVKDDVWANFLNSAAVEIKVAESDSEDKLRRNCTNEVSECFRTACKEQMDPNNPDGSYDMCITNPEVFKSLCKVKLEPCLIATGSSYDNPSGIWWDGLIASLTSWKVDACTKEIKDCLLSEDRCGKDYSGCIGFSTEDIGYICPFEKLTACMSENKNDEDAVRKYVAKVAQGIALNIDNNMLTICQSALKTAMMTFCGDENSCPNAVVDENMFKDIMSVQLCEKQTDEETGKDTYGNCSTDAYSFKNQSLVDGNVTPLLVNKIDLSSISYNLNYGDNSDSSSKSSGSGVSRILAIQLGLTADGQKNSTCNDPFCEQESVYETDDRYGTNLYSNTELKRVIKSLNNNFNSVLSSIESDPKVQYCMTGRQVKGFDDKWIGKTKGKGGSGGTARFPNLTKNAKSAIANELLNAVSPVYFDTQQQVVDEQMNNMINALTNRINEIVAISQEQQDFINQNVCDQFTFTKGNFNVHKCDGNWTSQSTYDSTTAVCSVHQVHKTKSCCGAGCDFRVKEEKDKKYLLPRIRRDTLREKGVGDDALTSEDDVEDMMQGLKRKEATYSYDEWKRKEAFNFK